MGFEIGANQNRNHMKNKLILVALVGASLIGLSAFVGCKSVTTVTTNPDGTFTTNTTSVIDTNRVALVAKQAAIDGTVDILSTHPQWLPQFQLAANDLNSLATSPTITLNSILTIAQELPVTQLKSNTAKLSFEGATLAISLLDVPQLPSEATADLQDIAKAIADGINTGIAESALAPPASAPTTGTSSNAPAN